MAVVVVQSPVRKQTTKKKKENPNGKQRAIISREFNERERERERERETLSGLFHRPNRPLVSRRLRRRLRRRGREESFLFESDFLK